MYDMTRNLSVIMKDLIRKKACLGWNSGGYVHVDKPCEDH